MIPTERGKFLDHGMVFPYPTGHNWRTTVQNIENKAEANNLILIRQALSATIRTMRSVRKCTAYLSKKSRTHSCEDHLRALPRTLHEAMKGEDALGWKAAAELEFNTLTEMGVIDHNYSYDDLRDIGVNTTPIPMSVALTNKYVGSTFDRHKVRMCVAGHKYNLQKGVHFDNVFAAAPNQNTARLLSTMTVDMKLKRKSWDISLAYCWADLPEGELIALRYPKGYERTDKKTGKPLFMVLRKNCYGHPAAAKQWSEHRDTFIMDAFDKDGWTCSKSTYDPCLFYARRGPNDIHPDNICTTYDLDGNLDRNKRPYQEEVWMSIHTDDCDAVGTTK